MVKLYDNKNSETGQWLRWIFGIPYLNAQDVAYVFFDYFMPVPEDAVAFSNYLIDTYMTATSTFLPTMWASPDMDDRTTNVCESFHAKFNELFFCSHPNIFVFIHVLLSIQEETYVKIRSQNAIRRKNYNKNF